MNNTTIWKYTTTFLGGIILSFIGTWASEPSVPTKNDLEKIEASLNQKIVELSMEIRNNTQTVGRTTNELSRLNAILEILLEERSRQNR